MTKNEQVVEQQVVTNPFEFGYTPGTLVSIEAELFSAVMHFIGATAQKEVKSMVVLNRFPIETGPEMDEATGMPKRPTEEVMMVISEEGKRAEEIFNECMNVHMQNINNGLAKKASDVGPVLDLG